MQILLQATTIDGNKVKSDVLVGTAGFGDKFYEHIQLSANTTWNVAHALNKRPTVMVEDSNGEDTDVLIEYIDDDNLKIYFTYATSGKAYCN